MRTCRFRREFDQATGDLDGFREALGLLQHRKKVVQRAEIVATVFDRLAERVNRLVKASGALECFSKGYLGFREGWPQLDCRPEIRFSRDVPEGVPAAS